MQLFGENKTEENQTLYTFTTIGSSLLLPVCISISGAYINLAIREMILHYSHLHLSQSSADRSLFFDKIVKFLKFFSEEELAFRLLFFKVTFEKVISIIFIIFSLTFAALKIDAPEIAE